MSNQFGKTSDATFSIKFVFGPGPEVDQYIKVTKDTMYTSELGYGFVTEKTRERDELLQITELGSAFEIQQTLAGQSVTNILMKDRVEQDPLKRSFCYSDKSDIPLCFRVKVPHSGNYNVKLIMGDNNSPTTVTVFSERRRCVLKNATIKEGGYIEHTFTANVCDIIPRGKEERYKDDGLDITILGDKACINSMTIEEATDVPTIYIAGDSTVTDQSAQYPYIPGNSYCGWAQMLPLFLKQGISVSNHSHSGLTTTSFRPHWTIVEESIKPNDFFFIQFGHNDQKDRKLEAFGGYAENLRNYIDEVKAKGAFPVIVTPVSRSTWNGPGNTFNDMLEEYSQACIHVAQEKEVPLIDLHAKSVEFIVRYGEKDAAKFFVPGDWTHHNDYGAFEMAKLVVEGIREACIQPLVDKLREISEDSIEQALMSETTLKVQTAKPIQSAHTVGTHIVPEYKDLQGHPAKVDIEAAIKLGIIRGEGHKFSPESSVKRIDFVAMTLKTVKYLILNVYNDMFEDVFGDEWFAGTIQAAYGNGFIDPGMTPDKAFKPQQPITQEEAVSIIINAYKSKKEIDSVSMQENMEEFSHFESVDGWAEGYVRSAAKLGILKSGATEIFEPKKGATRGQVAVMLKRLVDALVDNK